MVITNILLAIIIVLLFFIWVETGEASTNEMMVDRLLALRDEDQKPVKVIVIHKKDLEDEAEKVSEAIKQDDNTQNW